MCGGETPNPVLKRVLELLLKAPPVEKILEFQNQNKTMNSVQKKIFEPKITPMIEKLENEHYQ